MIYLLWTVINIVFILYFFYLLAGIIFKGKEFFNSNFRVISIFVLVFVFAQIISGGKKEIKNNEIILNTNLNSYNSSKFSNFVLEDNFIFKINTIVSYSENTNKNIPTKCNSYLTGFVCGFDWELKSFYTSDEKYLGDGILEWHLFGINIYKQSKRFEGEIPQKTKI